MDKKVLSELALYYGDLKMPQGFEINSYKLCEDIFKYVFFRDEFSYSKEWEKLNKKCLDHDHKTGLFRNIICNRCNVIRGNNDRKII